MKATNSRSVAWPAQFVEPGYHVRQELRRHIAARAVQPVSRTEVFRNQSLVRTSQFY